MDTDAIMALCVICAVVGLFSGFLMIEAGNVTEIVNIKILDNMCSKIYGEGSIYVDIDAGFNFRIGCTNPEFIQEQQYYVIDKEEAIEKTKEKCIPCEEPESESYYNVIDKRQPSGECLYTFENGTKVQCSEVSLPKSEETKEEEALYYCVDHWIRGSKPSLKEKEEGWHVIDPEVYYLIENQIYPSNQWTDAGFSAVKLDLNLCKEVPLK